MSFSLASLPVGLIPISVALAYLLIVGFARRRVYDHIHKKYAHLARDPPRMTPTEAQDITHASIVWDMPLVMSNALSFAIVRTYGVPSISRILCGSKELKAGPFVSKRYLDTAIIAATWSFCPISTTDPPTELYARYAAKLQGDPDPRTFIGIARMNWLHAHYPISNDDYLYTLSLFIFEPIRWAQKYGWRSLSRLEVQARYVFYAQLGRSMGIDDIPASVDELLTWSEEYEEQHMVPADTNKEMVEGLINELLLTVPSFAHGLFRRLLVCVFDERTRIALQLPRQPRWVHVLVKTAVILFKFAQGHLLLPRLNQKYIVPLDTPMPPSDGTLARMRPGWPVSKPWYTPRPTGLRLLLARMQIALGLMNEECLPGRRYESGGYRLEELGPTRWRDAGHEQVLKSAGDMMGCPVRGVWARDGAIL